MGRHFYRILIGERSNVLGVFNNAWLLPLFFTDRVTMVMFEVIS